MGKTRDFGRRIELVPMDRHFSDATIAIYMSVLEDLPVFKVHTYSTLEGVTNRINFIVQAMSMLGEMQCEWECGCTNDTFAYFTGAAIEPLCNKCGENLEMNANLRFPCGSDHERACKRLFLEACKIDPNTSIEKRSSTILDKKTGRNVSVENCDQSVYKVIADGEEDGKERRVSAIAGGLMKLGDMAEVEGTLDKVKFPCGHSHDSLVGLLLVRAPNVRAIVREQEMAASRGVLAAPSQQ